MPQSFRSGGIYNLANIEEYLKSGYNRLKHSNSTSIAASIEYGEWLNVAFELHSLETMQGQQTLSWKEWLQEKVGIGDSYARKLRSISDVLGKYESFKKLGLPIADVYNLLMPIKGMLLTNAKIATYWRG